MNTPCKILAMAWMALRPFSTNVHADTINWEEVSHFFNFDTIAEEKRTHLEMNIRLLVEEQLKLPSGQNLWKAFQFWENQHPELGFQFEFTLTSILNAGVALKGLKSFPKNKQIFSFEVVVNKIFAEKLEENQLFNQNMLYRPCLIKLVDPDNPENWEYHLREQKLPFFITLAHEFLHSLNQLERIAWILETLGMRTMEDFFAELNLINMNSFNINSLVFNRLCLFSKEKLTQSYRKNFSKQFNQKYNGYLKGITSLAILFETIFPIQKFLAKKLGLPNNKEILKTKYKQLWQNNNNDDSLDEMTVILGSKRQIDLNKKVFIGETTFLREYYKDKSIISWSHDSAYELKFWERMGLLLEKDYATQILANSGFGVNKTSLASFHIDDHASINFEKIEYRNSFEYPIARKNSENKIIELIKKKKVRYFFLKDNRKIKEKKIEVIELLRAKEAGILLLPKCYRSIKLENYQIVDLAEVNMKALKKYSIQDADLISQKLDCPIIIVFEDDDQKDSLQYQYLIYEKSKMSGKVSVDGIKNFLDSHLGALKLYYDGIQFYSIIKH